MSLTKDKLRSFGFFDIAVPLCSLVFIGFILHYGLTGHGGRIMLATRLVPFGMLTYILIQRGKLYPKAGKRANLILTIILSCLLFFSFVWMMTQYYDILWLRTGAFNGWDYMVAVLGIALAVEITRREHGKAIPIIIGVAAIYCLFGQHFPLGPFSHGGIILKRLISSSSLEITQGIFGLLPQVGLTWIAIFLILAGFAKAFGNLDALINVCKIIPRFFRYGVPQTAVVSSLVVGSFTGSAAANVAATGSFTIPLMKKHGVPPSRAGATEAVASSGGQVMPPIMGAAAFVMCELIGERYIMIAARGLAPALLFYFATALGVYLISMRFMKPLAGSYTSEEFAVRRADVINIIPLIVTVFVLIFLLAYFLMGIMLAGFISVYTLLVGDFILLLIRAGRGDSSGLKALPKTLLAGVICGTQSAIGIAVLLSAMGIIVSFLTVTGFTINLSILLLEVAGGSMWVLLLLVAITCLIFGMGMPTVASYLLAIILVAPALKKFGIPLLYSHFFVFYLAVLSGITPPVAIASAVGSKISGAKFWDTCIEAIKLALPLFILPWLFIVRSEILDFDLSTIPTFFIIAIGFIGIVLGLQGGEQQTSLRDIIERIILFALGFAVLFYTTVNPLWILLLVMLIAACGWRVWRRIMTRPSKVRIEEAADIDNNKKVS